MKIITAAILDELTFFGMVAHVIMRIVPLLMIGVAIYATRVYASNSDRFVVWDKYDAISSAERTALARQGYRKVLFQWLSGALIVAAIVGIYPLRFWNGYAISLMW